MYLFITITPSHRIPFQAKPGGPRRRIPTATQGQRVVRCAPPARRAHTAEQSVQVNDSRVTCTTLRLLFTLALSNTRCWSPTQRLSIILNYYKRLSECELGRYSAKPSSTTCSECEVGRHSNVTAAVSCIDCLPGTASSYAGQSACTACEVGRYSTQPSSTTCSDCEVGPGFWNATP